MYLIIYLFTFSKKVYFGEFVPDPFPIDDTNIIFESLVSNRNEFTYIKITYTHVFNFDDIKRNYAILIVFDTASKGWAEGLGYTPNVVIYNYPC
jgi:hypothetical protein